MFISLKFENGKSGKHHLYIAYSLPSFLKTKMISIFAQVSELIDFPKPLIAAVNGPTVSHRALYFGFVSLDDVISFALQ